MSDHRRDLVVRWLHRAGWALGPRLPRPVSRMIVERGSALALRRDGAHVRQLRENLSVIIGASADDDLVRAGLASYLRNFLEVLALPGWSPDSILARVQVTNRPMLDAAMRDTGAIIVLPHSGNWDLAGAWACLSDMPVTTVAEQLNDPEFAAFRTFRESLGMEILSHRDPGTVRRLSDAAVERRLVCLVADRDLSGTGVPVRWGTTGPMITMPAGPALVARRTGAALIPMVARFTGTDVGDGMIMTLADPVPPAPGRDGLISMTQQVADVFAHEIARAPQDWHLMQPFFPTPFPAARA